MAAPLPLSQSPRPLLAAFGGSRNAAGTRASCAHRGEEFRLGHRGGRRHPALTEALREARASAAAETGLRATPAGLPRRGALGDERTAPPGPQLPNPESAPKSALRPCAERPGPTESARPPKGSAGALGALGRWGAGAHSLPHAGAGPPRPTPARKGLWLRCGRTLGGQRR